VRSRLWRIVLTGDRERGDNAPIAAVDAEPLPAGPSAAQKARVLALIRRLPLEFEDDADPAP
jgi:hypothetical protein